MGILNPKGNLYSKIPLNPGAKPTILTPGHGRNPMSPLPEPPVPPVPNTTTPALTASTAASTTAAICDNEHPATPETSQSVSHQPRARTSIVDVNDQNNQSFTTSIYLNQTQQQAESAAPPAQSGQSQQQHVIPAKSYEPVVVVPPVTSPAVIAPPPSSSSVAAPTSGIKGIKWSVYLSKNKPSRHVTVIPINNDVEVKTPTEDKKIELTSSNEELQKREADEVSEEEHFYDAIFDIDEGSHGMQKIASTSQSASGTATRTKRSERRRQQSPTAKAPPLPLPVLQSGSEEQCRRQVKQSQGRDGNLSPVVASRNP